MLNERFQAKEGAGLAVCLRASRLRRSGGGEEGDAVDFSEPSGWVATGGIKHGDFVTFGEAFVKPFLGDLGAFI
jgi:hypothetical protein